MSLLGKVAQQRWITVVAVIAIATPAFAAAMLNPADELTRPDTATPAPITPGLAAPHYSDFGFTAGWVPAGYVYEPGLSVVGAAHSGDLQGMTDSLVYRNTTDDTLAFAYVVRADPGNQSFINHAELGGRVWKDIDIWDTGAVRDGLTGSGTVSPDWMTGEPNTIGRYETVTGESDAPYWDFSRMGVGTVIGPDDDSAEVWFFTNAKDVMTAYIAYSGPGATGVAEVVVPVIPDPATLALLGLGASGFALFRRRRTA